MVMIFSIVAATLMVIAGRMISESAKQTKKMEISGAEAENVARAGLVDAINWFIRKGIVKSGNPIANPPYQYIDDAFINSSNTLSSDTMDSTIGIVNQYALESKNNLWARYEVHRQLNPAGTPTAVSVDPHAVHDVTGEMMNTGNLDGLGLVWSLESIGYIYKQLDSTKAYNQAPNQVLGSARIRTVIRKMAVNTIANSTLIATNISSLRVTSLGRVNAQSNFCTSAVNISGGPVSSGSGAYQNYTAIANPTALAAIDENAVFGLGGATDVKSLADFIGTATNPINFSGSYKLAYYEGNVTYDPASTNALLKKLSGSGVLYVNGNLSILDGTNSFYDGLIYATGAVTIGIACEIQGQVIGRNGVVVGATSGMTGDNANVYFGTAQLSNASKFVGSYREVKTSTKLFQNITNP
jgi:hypothetical protein